MKKRILSFLLALCILFSMVPVHTYAATPSVNIVSFMRGAQNDLRSSELLWAEVTGYDGNVQELTYKWTNTLGTSLYVFNTHNMYSVQNTDGEREIYPAGGSSLGSMEDHRIHEATYAGTGFAWAAIYGANLEEASSLVGTVTVEVYTPEGVLLCSDSHTGTVKRVNVGSWWWPRYEYQLSGFVWFDLQADLDHAVFGLFEGETLDVRDLLGRSAIVHIHCVQSSVTNAKIISANGSEYILIQGSEPAYTVTGLKKGETQIQITVEKQNCKFHEYTSGTAYPKVHVFKKPVPVPTTTTITLTPESIDPDCEYFINGQQGEKQPDDSVIFTGLTPNTKYEIEVRAEYEDNQGNTEYVYAYVESTTLPVYLATVNLYLDGVLTPVEQIHQEQVQLVLSGDNGINVVLSETGTAGVYTAVLENGTYYLWHVGDDHTHQISDYPMIIENANATKNVHHYSVTYDTAGGAFESGETSAYSTHYSGTAVNVIGDVPVWDGYAFVGWVDQDGNEYSSTENLTPAIANPYVLTAVWEDAVDLYVNINIQHISQDGEGHNNHSDRHNITFTVDQRATGSTGNFTEIFEDTIAWDGISDLLREDYEAASIAQGDISDITAYQAVTATLTNVPKDREYTFTSTKSGYSLVSVEQTADENGNILITANLIFDPNTFDFVYSVELDEEAKTRPQELKPVAVNVRVTSWGDTPYDEDFGFPAGTAKIDWYAITQQHNTYTRVALDENGQGAGSYPVWIQTAEEGSDPYHYRIEIVSYELPDGTIVAAENVDNANVNYNSVGSRYTSDIVVTDGQDPDPTDTDTLTGAWHENGVQNGQVKAIIHIPVYDVTFVPNGGVLNGTEENTVVEDQIVIPNLDEYVPTREGGYVFEGWYVADENGNITGQQVVSGGPLTSDVTLIAKWKDPRQVYGTVTVDGSYELNGVVTPVKDADRAKSALVILQEMRDGIAYNVAGQIVNVTWSETEGTAQYEPFIVPDDGKQYRIEVRILDFTVEYQNETTAAGVYNQQDYTAVFAADPKLTFVNAYVHFDPDMYYQPAEIVSNAIGHGFRPQSGQAEYFYTVVNSGDAYAIVPQHEVDPYGVYIPVNADSGYGYVGEDGTTMVWKQRYDGVLYDYQMELSKVVDYNGNTISREELPNAPFYVTYGQSSRYSPAYDAPTGTLQAMLVPKQYAVIFELGAEDATMDKKYGVANDAGTIIGYAMPHIWSYETDLTGIEATRPGHSFGGWYLDAECTIPAENHIEAAVAADTVLYAKWIPYADVVDLTVIINHDLENGGIASNYEKTLYTQLVADDRDNRENTDRVFADVDGYSKSYTDWHTDGNVHQDVLKIPGYYENLSPENDYSVNVTLDGYYVKEKTVEHILQEDGSTVHKVTVVLQYDPELMNLEFYVRMDESVPQKLYPVSAEVKVTSWHSSIHAQDEWAWEHITPHHTTTVTVTIDPETGRGTGDYQAWQWYDSHTPYHYRIEVVQLNLGDGSVVSMSETQHAVSYAGSDYYADIEVSGGSVPQIPTDGSFSTDLEGVYGQEADGGYTQVGQVGAVIDIDRVVFHANNPEFTGDSDIFRTYYYNGVHQPEGSGDYALNEDNTITAFYDIPVFEYFTHNQYIFKGWYLDPETEERPISWTDTYSGDVDIYAHWVFVGEVTKEDDGKIYVTDSYGEYDLIGNQIRTAESNPQAHYGEAGAGLRFITSLSERVYDEMNAIHTNNSAGVEYGFVIAMADWVEAKAADDSYMLKYKHSTINGEDTTESHSYVMNTPCRVPDKEVVDHFSGENYRLYTAVITYKNLTGDALTNAQNTNFVARSYMRYFDANGLERIHYNNYTGDSRTCGGVNTCYTDVENLLNGL